MRSGADLVRRGCILPLVVIAVLSACEGLAAQEPTSTNPPSAQGSNPTNLPPAKPISDAAVKASDGTTSSIKQDDSAKDIPDVSSTVKLGAGDLLEITVYNVPELASKVRVSNAGDVYLPLIDYVHVEDLTQEEAQALIEKRLSDGGFVRNPHVTIFVSEPTSQGVTIIGEVVRAGIYPLIGEHKLYEVVSQAGGFSQNASRKISVVRRDLAEPIRISLPRNLADDLSGNIEIKPGDTITVPKAPIIYVVGDVGRPSGILVDNGQMTVLQALALAGGTNRTAKLGGTRIIRKSATGMTETKVEVKKMLEAKAPDMQLQADDILFIPVSGGKILAARTFEAAMATATALAIYSVHP